jgi:sulfite reductase alpha subunit-like flavoprotein
MSENLEMVHEYLYKNKGFFYLCGTAGSSIDACKAAVVEAGIEVGKLSREEAENWLT